MADTNKFKERLKELRKEYSLTQQELADKIGVVRTAIANYETGRTIPDADTLSLLAKIFNTTTDYLLGNSDIRNPYKMVNRQKLAQLIIELRNKKGYSQRKLAMVSEVSNSTISRIESAISDADPETLKKLAPFLGVSYETLMQAAGYIDNESIDTNKKTPKKQIIKDDENELTPEELELLKKIKSDPELSILFHDLKSAPKKKIKQLLKTWEFVNEQFEEMEKELNDENK